MAKRKAAVVEAPVAVAEKPSIADLSAKLVDLMNTDTKAVTLTPALPPAKKDTRTSVFTGTLVLFGGISSFGVKTFVAAEADSVKRNMLHAHKTVKQMVDGVEKDVVVPCHGRIKDGKSFCSSCNTTVEKDQIVKGVEVSKDKYIVFDETDVASCKPAYGEKIMKVTEYVDPATVNPKYIEDSEYVALEDEGGRMPYDHFVAGLRESGLWGKGQRIKGGREQHFLVRPEGYGLMMHYLYAEYEVRNCTKFEAPQNLNPELTATFADMIRANKAEFVPAPYDTFLGNQRSLIEIKSKNQTVKPIEAEKPVAPAADLIGALKDALKTKKASAGK